jgi:hypothetical protein
VNRHEDEEAGGDFLLGGNLQWEVQDPDFDSLSFMPSLANTGQLFAAAVSFSRTLGHYFLLLYPFLSDTKQLFATSVSFSQRAPTVAPIVLKFSM